MFAHVTVTKLADKGAARLTSASLGLSRASSFAIFKDHPLQFPILLPILDPLSRFKFLSYTCRLSRIWHTTRIHPRVPKASGSSTVRASNTESYRQIFRCTWAVMQLSHVDMGQMYAYNPPLISGKIILTTR
jgi:hypothetical protein